MSNGRRRTHIDTRRDKSDELPLTEKRDPPRPWPEPPPQPQDTEQNSQRDNAGDSSDSGTQNSED